MVKKWVHIHLSDLRYKFNDIFFELAEKAPNPQKEIRELALSINSRLNMIDYIDEQLSLRVDNLLGEIEDVGEEYHCTKQKEGHDYRLQRTTGYGILVLADALIFELKACCDLMYEYYNKIFSLLYQIKKGIDKINDSMDDDTWFKKLCKIRKHFIHRQTINIAIDISQKCRKDVLFLQEEVLEENIQSDDLERKSGFRVPTHVKYMEIKDIVDSFRNFCDFYRLEIIGKIKAAPLSRVD